MLKLLIVDDERIICDTISRLIDWNKLGIHLIGTAENGLDALNIIIDESPEIVMTDIRMPGLTGLELIKRVTELNRITEFIVLSGYGEFEYAKEAMRYGVRHYLLKPCNEKQITKTIEEVKEHFSSLVLEKSRQPLYQSLHQGILFNIVSDSIGLNNHNYKIVFDKYSNFLDFNNIPYALFYIYYLENKFLESAMDNIDKIFDRAKAELPPYYIYVKNTLVFFYPADLADSEIILSKVNSLSFPDATVQCKCEYKTFVSLSTLLNAILPKINRYEIIYLRMFRSILTISNRDSVVKRVDMYISCLLKGSSNAHEILEKLKHIFDSVQDLLFLQSLGNIVITKIMSYRNVDILENNEQFITDFYNSGDIETASYLLSKKLAQIFHSINQTGNDIDMSLSHQIKKYVCENLSNPNLSLKWISEQILFMNSDYVSKRFIKETGEKFSHYIVRKRIESAKKLLTSQTDLNVQEVAQQVGCGNNPLYFSQLFKKYTGMTPSSFYKKQKGL